MPKRGSGPKATKKKATVTLTAEAEDALNRLAMKPSERAAIVERALIELAIREHRRIRDARELQILNENAPHLAMEAEDVLAYQAGF